MKRLDRTEVIFKILAYVLLTLFALCCLYPFVYVLSASLSSKDAVDQGLVTLIPVGFPSLIFAKSIHPSVAL